MPATALVLPPQPVPVIDAGGLVSLPWRSALQNALNNLQAQITALAALEGDTTALEAALAALQAELDAAEASIAAHIADTANPHATTAAQVGADPAGTAAAAVAAHVAQADPHTQYAETADLGTAAFADTVDFDAAGSAAAALSAANSYTDSEISGYSSDTHTWSAAQTYSADIIISGASWRMVQDTADGANTGRWLASGGGAPGASRAAYFAAHGNEHATSPGQAQIIAGTGFDVVITASSGGIIRPSVDNAAPLGSVSFRYAGIHTVGVENSGAEYQSGIQTPAQFTADQTDFAVANVTAWLRVSTNASRALNSMTGGASGRRVLITNIGAVNNLTIPNEGAGTAANRFLTPGAATFTLNPQDSVWAVYDSAPSRWRIIGA